MSFEPGVFQSIASFASAALAFCELSGIEELSWTVSVLFQTRVLTPKQLQFVAPALQTVCVISRPLVCPLLRFSSSRLFSIMDVFVTDCEKCLEMSRAAKYRKNTTLSNILDT